MILGPPIRAMLGAEAIETAAAQRVLEFARHIARYHSMPGDLDATALAILCRAIELATPDSTPALRAAVFGETP